MLEKISKITSAFSDERGDIKNILEKAINHVALITSKAGSIRGNHYHPNDTQYCYLITGKFESHAKDINDDKFWEIVDSWRSDNLWKKENNEWKLKYPVK